MKFKFLAMACAAMVGFNVNAQTELDDLVDGVISADPCLNQLNSAKIQNAWIPTDDHRVLTTAQCLKDPLIGIGIRSPRVQLDASGSLSSGGGVFSKNGFFSNQNGFDGDFGLAINEVDQLTIKSNSLGFLNYGSGTNEVSLKWGANLVEVFGKLKSSSVESSSIKSTSARTEGLIVANPGHFPDEDVPYVGDIHIIRAPNSDRPQFVIEREGEDGQILTMINGNTLYTGDIRAKAITVELHDFPFPDYVFEDSYDMMTLSEVESFVKENGHLPKMKSAKEYKAEGVELKSLVLMQMEKIEELTLHLIDLNKEVERLKIKGNEKE